MLSLLSSPAERALSAVTMTAIKVCDPIHAHLLRPVALALRADQRRAHQ
ncbi:MAG: hypothetical protein ACREUD_00065 [Gammaproteobacteria bacterium]